MLTHKEIEENRDHTPSQIDYLNPILYHCYSVKNRTLKRTPLVRNSINILLRSIIPITFWIGNTNSFAQKLTPNQTKTIRNTVIRYLGKEANLRVLETGKAAFLPVGKDTLFNIHGLRYVFKLKGDSAIRIDQSVYHGSNFYRYLFQHDGKMMSLGGYGMFVTNNNLEAFNAEAREWYLVKTHGDIPNSIKGAGLRFGHFIFVLNNCIDGNNVDDARADDHFYRLDLRDMTWTQFKEFRSDHLKLLPHDFFYLKDYVITKGQHHSFIYNLKTQEYIYCNNDAVGIKQFNGYNTNVHDNQLEIWILDSAQTVIKDPHRDIDALWNENKKNAKHLELNPSIWQQYPNEANIGIIIILLLLTGGLWFKKQRKQKRTTHKLHPLVNKILSSDKTELTQDELDQILSIDHMEGESKKTKRHRLLAMVESQYPGLIEREKDSTDKRRFLYNIHKNQV